MAIRRKEQHEKMVRIWAFVKPETNEQLKKWADELGMTYSHFCSLAVWVGGQKVAESLLKETKET